MTATMWRYWLVPSVAGDGEAVGVADSTVEAWLFSMKSCAALLAVRVARQAAGLAQLLEPGLAAGDDLVHVGLVAGVPQDGVGGRVEHPVQGERQLDRAEVAACVTSLVRIAIFLQMINGKRLNQRKRN